MTRGAFLARGKAETVTPALCQSDCQTPDQFSTKHVHSSSESCAKKAPIATTPEQSVIVTSHLLAVGSSIDDVTISGWHRAFDELSFGEFAQESSAFFGAKKLRKWSHDI